MDERAKRAQSIVGMSKGRPQHDFYITPPEATLALLQKEKFEGSIWEPACGNGAICEVFKDQGYDIYGSDLIDRGYGDVQDFLKSDKKHNNIVTNPPFVIAQEFIEHSLSLTDGKVAMLCKLVLLEGQKRKSFFEKSPLARVHVFSKRVSFYRNGITQKNTSMMAFAWFVFEHGYEGPPSITWI